MAAIPKPPSQRRRRNKPASYGASEPIVADAGKPPSRLGLEDPHPLVTDLWRTLKKSVESQFYSDADWQRVRIECWYLNELLTAGKTPGAQAWSAVQSGLNNLLVSPADKRRIGVELQQPHTEAPRAVVGLDEYRAL